MEKFVFCLCILFSLLLLSTTINARKDISQYWKSVMKDQPMPQSLQELISNQMPVANTRKTSCHDSEQNKKNFIKKFDQEPNISAYDNGIEPTQKEEFVKFDQDPNIFVYDNGVKTTQKGKFAKEFDQESNISAYLKEKFSEEFDQEPNISAYDNDIKPKQKEEFSDNFEPKPNISAYSD